MDGDAGRTLHERNLPQQTTPWRHEISAVRKSNFPSLFLFLLACEWRRAFGPHFRRVNLSPHWERRQLLTSGFRKSIGTLKNRRFLGFRRTFAEIPTARSPAPSDYIKRRRRAEIRIPGAGGWPGRNFSPGALPAVSGDGREVTFFGPGGNMAKAGDRPQKQRVAGTARWRIFFR